MSKVITFSRKFPSYHIRKGEKTYFVEKFWESVGMPDMQYVFNLPDEYQRFLRADSSEVWAKKHTIRKGNRWKAGDKFSPRVWSDMPYKSKQLIIAPDVEIKKVYDFELKDNEYLLNGKKLNLTELKELAFNDGLSSDDLELWFQKPFVGQVIFWDEFINY